MAIPDEVLLKFMQETTAAVSAGATSIASMEKRLFGNGQPGIIEKLYEHGETLAKENADKIALTDAQVKSIAEDRRLHKRVAKVLYSALMLEGGFIGWLILHYAALANVAKEVLAHSGH